MGMAPEWGHRLAGETTTRYSDRMSYEWFLDGQPNRWATEGGDMRPYGRGGKQPRGKTRTRDRLTCPRRNRINGTL